AHVPRASELCYFSVGLWSGLGQTQAHSAGVFGTSQRPTHSPLYACASFMHLGRSLAEALASWWCQKWLDLRQVARLPGSLARLQSPHHAVASRCRGSARLPEDTQNLWALSRHARPVSAAHRDHALQRFTPGV